MEAFALGHRACFCNMFIMRKQLFQEYCSWLFPILQRFCDLTDMSAYSREELRTPGHLSERLLNIWYNHQIRCGAQWRTKQLQCVHFEHPEPAPVLGPVEDDAEDRPVVPVVLAADGTSVPMLTTTVYSLLKNASTDRFYDIVVVAQAISWEQQEVVRRFLASRFHNASLRFFDAHRLLASHGPAASNALVGPEAYCSLVAQDALPFYDKVLYLDCDLVVEGDVAELYRTDLGDELIGAVRDIDYLGNLNMKDGVRAAYSRDVLKMDDPYGYFQTGVLLLNTKELRASIPTERWLEALADDSYAYGGQDILNRFCEGRVAYLDPSWNVLTDCGGRVDRIFALAPAQVYADYLSARSHERIIHYAGADKPWSTPGCDRRERYWLYARDTPFYESLLSHLAGGAPRLGTNGPRPANVLSQESPLRGIIDPLLPLGSERREAVKAVARAMRGLN